MKAFLWSRVVKMQKSDHDLIVEIHTSLPYIREKINSIDEKLFAHLEVYKTDCNGFNSRINEIDKRQNRVDTILTIVGGALALSWAYLLAFVRRL